MLKHRNYGIDLLRILSMYMIVILHILGHGGILNNLGILSLKYNLVWLLEIICYCSVNCYALITGYVMVDKKFNYKKIFYLWMDVLFWGLLITFIMNIIFPNLIGKKDFFMAVFNVSYDRYWYFCAYFALFFFIPFINEFINKINRSMFKRLVLTIIILFSFINIFTDTFDLKNGYSFLWLMSLYFIGAYVRKFVNINNISKLYMGLGMIFAILLTFFVKLVLVKYPNISFGLFSDNILLSYTSFTILFFSISLLLIFSNIKFNNKYIKKVINRIAPATFGVYLIHDNFLVREFFIKNRFVCLIDYDWYILLLLILFCALVVYIACSFLEMIRKFIFKKLNLFKFEDFLFNKIKVILKKIEKDVVKL